MISGSGVFNDGRTEPRLVASDTVIFPAGEVHQVRALTRMVLYRVQAGADRHPESLDAWPASRSSPLSAERSASRIARGQFRLWIPAPVAKS